MLILPSLSSSPTMASTSGKLVPVSEEISFALMPGLERMVFRIRKTVSESYPSSARRFVYAEMSAVRIPVLFLKPKDEMKSPQSISGSAICFLIRKLHP